jgi:hypothetical protein
VTGRSPSTYDKRFGYAIHEDLFRALSAHPCSLFLRLGAGSQRMERSFQPRGRRVEKLTARAARTGTQPLARLQAATCTPAMTEMSTRTYEQQHPNSQATAQSDKSSYEQGHSSGGYSSQNLDSERQNRQSGSTQSQHYQSGNHSYGGYGGGGRSWGGGGGGRSWDGGGGYRR